MTLKTENVSVAYGQYKILNDISFTVEPESWLMVIGPNGAGKSTLLGAISQSTPYSGTILLDGSDIKKLKPKERAKKTGILTQNHNVGYSFTVREVAEMGRYAHSESLFSKSGGDTLSVDKALELTGLKELAEQSVLTLSGGELQRTFLAQLIAQNPEIMLLDEPANHLDLVYLRQVFALISDWIKTTGRSVISVVHDLSLAKKYGTHALLLNKGNAYKYGSTDEVLTRENLEAVYGLDVYGWMNEMHELWR